MVEESITTIDQARDSTLSDVADDPRILLEINCAGLPGHARQWRNREYTLK
jgi:hypothetical protein